MKSTVLAGLLFFALTGLVTAQEHPEHPKVKTAQATDSKSMPAKWIEATLVGENICLGCSLKKSSGAAAQCDIYGHRHVLKVSSASVDGKEAPEMKGWILHYLETEKAQPFIKENHQKTVTVSGKIYSDERVFEVSKSVETKKPEHPEHPK